MGIGMGKIDDKSVDEFIERSELWQDVIGPCGPGQMPMFQVDECGDADGFSTIRPYDGSVNGDTDTEPIATVFKSEHADMLVSDVIDYTRITPDDIRNHIGLSSNVAKEAWSIFNKKLKRHVQERLHRQARQAEKEAEAA